MIARLEAAIGAMQEATKALESFAEGPCTGEMKDLIEQGGAAREKWDAACTNMRQHQLSLSFSITTWGPSTQDKGMLRKAEELISVPLRYPHFSASTSHHLSSQVIRDVRDVLDRLDVLSRELDQMWSRCETGGQRNWQNLEEELRRLNEIQASRDSLYSDWKDVVGKLVMSWALDVSVSDDQVRRDAEEVMRRKPWPGLWQL